MNDSINLSAPDLAREFPRSPRKTLGNYVIAARTLDKCRALLNGTLGDYYFDCPLDHEFFGFSEIKAEDFKNYVATGASDEEVATWIQEKAQKREEIEIIRWNNRMRDLRISDLPDDRQKFLEQYIPQFIPENRRIYCWFDVYDIEEKRI